MDGEHGESTHIFVTGIVSGRDKQPYVQLLNDKGVMVQLSMAQARQVALDILIQASRAEADAMIYTFFDKKDFPKGAAAALMVDFREYRAGLDDEHVEHDHRKEPG